MHRELTHSKGEEVTHRRWYGALVMAAMLVGASAPSAGASTAQDRIAAHRAEVQAKIACHRAEMAGRSCGGQQGGAAVASAPVRTSAPLKTKSSTKVIEVIISRQILRAWEGDRVVLETSVSTGGPGNETPTGRFSILSKEANHWSTQYSVNMPYAMRVVSGIFIHELPITPDGRRLGTGSVGSAVSHGCVRVPVGTAASLYNWTPVGIPVIIH